jgi:acetyl esterase/lipase
VRLQCLSRSVWQLGFVLALVAATAGKARAEDVPNAEPKVELLWPQGAPGANGDSPNDKPTLTIWLPPAEKAVGTGVVVCPGGGYGGLAKTHEGVDVARWLNTLGVAAFVLEYRHRGTGYGHPAPLDDAQRALRTVRARAAEFHVKPDQIGVLGFSAGGHLASTLDTHFDKGLADAADPISRVSCRPDFAILIYPVISLDAPFTHGGSKANLLGKEPDPKLVASLSNETQVTAETPPTFLVHTTEDTAVPPENSLAFYAALRKANVPAEMHIYEKGAHGLGLAPNQPGMKNWPGACADWLRAHGFLGKD